MAEPDEKAVVPTTLAPDVIANLILNQQRELEIRAAELQLKSKDDDHTYAHAGKVLEAQERDRANQRTYRYRSSKSRYIFIAVIVLFALVFIGALAFMNKDQLAMEIVKGFVYVGAGAVSGYFSGRTKRGGSQTTNSETESYSDEERPRG